MMASLLSVLCYLAVSLGLMRTAAAASLLPYGTENGDTLAEQDVSSVALTESFSFLGESFASVRVSRRNLSLSLP